MLVATPLQSMIPDHRKPRVISEIKKNTPRTPLDYMQARISGELKLRVTGTVHHTWQRRRVQIRGGALLISPSFINEGITRQSILTLRNLSLKPGIEPRSFALYKQNDVRPLVVFQASTQREYEIWVKTLAIEIMRQTPLDRIKYLDIMGLAMSTCSSSKSASSRISPRLRRTSSSDRSSICTISTSSSTTSTGGETSESSPRRSQSELRLDTRIEESAYYSSSDEDLEKYTTKSRPKSARKCLFKENVDKNMSNGKISSSQESVERLEDMRRQVSGDRCNCKYQDVHETRCRNKHRSIIKINGLSKNKCYIESGSEKMSSQNSIDSLLSASSIFDSKVSGIEKDVNMLNFERENTVHGMYNNLHEKVINLEESRSFENLTIDENNTNNRFSRMCRSQDNMNDLETYSQSGDTDIRDNMYINLEISENKLQKIENRFRENRKELRYKRIGRIMESRNLLKGDIATQEDHEIDLIVNGKEKLYPTKEINEYFDSQRVMCQNNVHGYSKEVIESPIIKSVCQNITKERTPSKTNFKPGVNNICHQNSVDTVDSVISAKYVNRYNQNEQKLNNGHNNENSLKPEAYDFNRNITKYTKNDIEETKTETENKYKFAKIGYTRVYNVRDCIQLKTYDLNNINATLEKISNRRREMNENRRKKTNQEIENKRKVTEENLKNLSLKCSIEVPKEIKYLTLSDFRSQNIDNKSDIYKSRPVYVTGNIENNIQEKNHEKEFFSLTDYESRHCKSNCFKNNEKSLRRHDNQIKNSDDRFLDIQSDEEAVELLLKRCQNSDSYVPVKDKLKLFESLCNLGRRLARSNEDLFTVPPIDGITKRAQSMHDLTRCGMGVREICKYFETRSEPDKMADHDISDQNKFNTIAKGYRNLSKSKRAATISRTENCAKDNFSNNFVFKQFREGNKIISYV